MEVKSDLFLLLWPFILIGLLVFLIFTGFKRVYRKKSKTHLKKDKWQLGDAADYVFH